MWWFIPSAVAGITGLLGFKLGQDADPNPVYVPNTGTGINPFQIGLLLIIGLVGLSGIKLMRDLFAR